MQAIPLEPGLTRAKADAALAKVIPEASIRAFLLQNLRFGEAPAWRIGSRGNRGFPAGHRRVGGAGRRDLSRSRLVRLGRPFGLHPGPVPPGDPALFPAARFVAVKDAGHWVHADNPEGFLGVLGAFLAL